jgi:5,10-methylenetetrahydromethanopterin reductase
MSLGILLLGDSPLPRMLEQAKLAEASGFDMVCLADERFYREVYACLAVFAGKTSSVALGPCVTDPYARHPALTAMAIATLDEICGQRAFLGIGAGISGFGELGITHDKPARAIREAITLIRRLLAGEQVDFQGKIVRFNAGRLGFRPTRTDIPIHVASNGPLGQRTAGAVADGAIMEACGSIEEVGAFRAEVEHGARQAGRDPRKIRLFSRLNACVAADGRVARDAVRPGVARLLGRRSLKLATAERQGLALSADAVASVGPAPYADGVKPYLGLLPLVSDRHVDAFALAGTVDEIVARVAALRGAGIDSIIIRPLAPEGGSVDDTIRIFGTKIWPATAAMQP